MIAKARLKPTYCNMVGVIGDLNTLPILMKSGFENNNYYTTPLLIMGFFILKRIPWSNWFGYMFF